MVCLYESMSVCVFLQLLNGPPLNDIIAQHNARQSASKTSCDHIKRI